MKQKAWKIKKNHEETVICKKIEIYFKQTKQVKKICVYFEKNHDIKVSVTTFNKIVVVIIKHTCGFSSFFPFHLKFPA